VFWLFETNHFTEEDLFVYLSSFLENAIVLPIVTIDISLPIKYTHIEIDNRGARVAGLRGGPHVLDPYDLIRVMPAEG